MFNIFFCLLIKLIIIIDLKKLIKTMNETFIKNLKMKINVQKQKYS